jgi:endonuclease III
MKHLKCSRRPGEGQGPSHPRAAPGPMPARGAKERAGEVLARFRETYPEPYSYLHHGSPFQLLVAVILSAQAPDALVNRRTPGLFGKYPTPEAMRNATVEELADLVHPVPFARSKARYLKETARLLVERHGGEVPRSMEDLTALPGVARKTASVVQGYVFGASEGVGVDTHVRRVSFRLGLTSEETPQKIERDLMALHPPEDWPAINFYYIQHGRHGPCVARRPRCPGCVVEDLCPRQGVTETAPPAGPRKAATPARGAKAAKKPWKAARKAGKR